jgi:hypothetical protein
MSIRSGPDGDLSPLSQRQGWRTIVVCLGLVVNESAEASAPLPPERRARRMSKHL